MRRVGTRAAVLLPLAAAALLAACGPPPPGREQRDWERMRQQQRYDAYESAPFFPNGAVMQAPPAHTMARDPALDSVPGPVLLAFYTGKAGGTYVATSPVVADSALRADGARQFAISCAPCHGMGGFGGGPVAANLTDKRPPSLRSRGVQSQPDGMLFDKITNGFGMMPPYGWQIPPRLRWAVIAYVRSLGAQPATPATRADSSWAAYFHFADSVRAAGGTLSTLFPGLGVP